MIFLSMDLVGVGLLWHDQYDNVLIEGAGEPSVTQYQQRMMNTP